MPYRAHPANARRHWRCFRPDSPLFSRFAAFFLSCAVAGAASAQAQIAESRAASEVLATKLYVVTEYGCAVLLIDFRNVQAEPAYLPPEEPIVQLRHESGEHAPYFPSTPIIDRPPYRLDEHVRIEPGQRYRIAIDLNRLYGMKKGWYAVRLDGGYWDPVRNLRIPGKQAVTSFYYGANCRPANAHALNEHVRLLAEPVQETRMMVTIR